MYRLEFCHGYPPIEEPDMGCKGCGPGYASPQEAIKGPKETVLFVTCPHTEGGKDMVAAVDVDPKSETFCKIISRVDFPHEADEVHHSGWNACSSCYDKPSAKRSHMVFPCLNSSRVYIINVEDKNNIYLHKKIEAEELAKFDVSFPHTSHCLADGNVMISTLGDKDNKNRGDFLLLDGATFEPKGVWPVGNPKVPFNYDFWYQPRRDVMISTEWGSPDLIKNGFNPAHVEDGHYGHSVHIFKWSTHEHLQTLSLEGPEGLIPLEVRFKHEPSSTDAFCGTALGSSIFLFRPVAEGDQRYEAKCLVTIPPKEVNGWVLPVMPSLITDILISMDDRFLFISNWFHGDIRQYDITDSEHPKLVSQIFLGGLIHTETEVEIVKDQEMTEKPKARYIKGKRVEGGPQMLQMSLDGKRLYVTNSLYRQWDKQFYPNLTKGGMILQVDVTDEGMKLNEEFLVDFADVEGGPYVAHEMRYPGGDCTSDIWI